MTLICTWQHAGSTHSTPHQRNIKKTAEGMGAFPGAGRGGSQPLDAMRAGHTQRHCEDRGPSLASCGDRGRGRWGGPRGIKANGPNGREGKTGAPGRRGCGKREKLWPAGRRAHGRSLQKGTHECGRSASLPWFFT